MTLEGILPTAAEIRQKMETVATEKDCEDLQDIANKINLNYANGHCYVTSRVSKLVLGQLKIEGYLITESDDQRDGYCLTISWK